MSNEVVSIDRSQLEETLNRANAGTSYSSYDRIADNVPIELIEMNDEKQSAKFKWKVGGTNKIVSGKYPNGGMPSIASLHQFTNQRHSIRWTSLPKDHEIRIEIEEAIEEGNSVSDYVELSDTEFKALSKRVQSAVFKKGQQVYRWAPAGVSSINPDDYR